MLPLDDRKHFYTMRSPQLVKINVLCTDHCPNEVRCGMQAATQIEDRKYQCESSPNLPQAYRSVSARVANTLLIEEDVHPYQTEVTLDLASPPEQVAAHFIGSWGGDLPCEVRGVAQRKNSTSMRSVTFQRMSYTIERDSSFGGLPIRDSMHRGRKHDARARGTRHRPLK